VGDGDVLTWGGVGGGSILERRRTGANETRTETRVSGVLAGQALHPGPGDVPIEEPVAPGWLRGRGGGCVCGLSPRSVSGAR
jgi:hypothetical protein